VEDLRGGRSGVRSYEVDGVVRKEEAKNLVMQCVENCQDSALSYFQSRFCTCLAQRSHSVCCRLILRVTVYISVFVYLEVVSSSSV